MLPACTSSAGQGSSHAMLMWPYLVSAGAPPPWDALLQEDLDTMLSASRAQQVQRTFTAPVLRSRPARMVCNLQSAHLWSVRSSGQDKWADSRRRHASAQQLPFVPPQLELKKGSTLARAQQALEAAGEELLSIQVGRPWLHGLGGKRGGTGCLPFRTRTPVHARSTV